MKKGWTMEIVNLQRTALEERQELLLGILASGLASSCCDSLRFFDASSFESILQ